MFAYPQESVKLPWRDEATSWYFAFVFFSPSHKTQFMSITKFRRQCITQVFAYPQESVKLPWRGEATNWRLVLHCRVWSHTVVFFNQEQTKQRLNQPKQINLNIHETKSAHPSNKKRLCLNYSCQYWEHCSGVQRKKNIERKGAGCVFIVRCLRKLLHLLEYHQSWRVTQSM